MCEHHYHYLGTELHRLSPERDREDGGVRTEERESVPRRESQSLSDARLHWHWVAGNQTPGLSPRCFSLKQGPMVLWIK